MKHRLLGLAASAALVASAGAAAFAQTSSGYHTPPKLIKAGVNTSAIAGPGTVIVQVFVNADGSFKVTKVIRSTNSGDDAAALEIAKSSTYSPARNGNTKVAEFYDYTLKFGAASTSSTSHGGVEAYQADVNSKRYAQAKTGLTAYLGSHPEDARANALLGVSDYFLNDYAGAVAAFNKASTVPSEYRLVAANAYAKAAEEALAQKDAATAVADATKANQFAPGAATLNLLANAQLQAGDTNAAIHSLEQANADAASDSKIDAKQRGTIAANLVAAYMASGQIDKAAALVAEVQRIDPSNTTALTRVITYYDNKAETAQKAGDYSGAAALWDKAGALGGMYAPSMYTKESIALMQGSKPDWKGAKAAADKALAIKPDDASANLAEGVALANDGKKADAITYLQKADASAKASGDTSVSSKAEQLLKQLGAAK